MDEIVFEPIGSAILPPTMPTYGLPILVILYKGIAKLEEIGKPDYINTIKYIFS